MSGHIVVVDDDAAFRGELVESLNQEGLIAIGHDPLTDPDSAIWATASTVVLDLCMPRMDGLAWIERLSSLSEAPKLVLMSGQAEDILTASSALAARRGLTALGALQKPFDIEELLYILRDSSTSNTDFFQSENPDNKHRCIYAAIHDNSLPLLYQPKVFLRNFEFNGAELLLSGYVPNYGYVAPSEIVSVASLSPTHLTNLTLHSLRCGISACAEWKKYGLKGPISVNIPASVLQSDKFFDLFNGIISRSNAIHSDIIVELTEDGIYNQSPKVIENLVRLRLRGVGIALDDIGERYSSLAHLSDLPINEIKVDMKLTHQSRLWSKSKDILCGLVSLAESLKIAITIEGVESADDLATIKPYSRAMIQGYYISPKVELSQLIEVANRRAKNIN